MLIVTILAWSQRCRYIRFILYIRTQDFNFTALLCPASALVKETADHVFYLATDLYPVDNPHFHDTDLYSFEDVNGGNKLRTPLFNNFSLKASF